MKQKRKRKHLEITGSPQTVKRSKASTNLQEVLQQEQSAVASTSGQTAKYSSSSSECFCTSSQEKLTGAGISKSSKWVPPPGHFLEDNTLVPEAKAKSSESEYFSCYSSLLHLFSAGFSKSSKWVPPPGHFLEDNTLVPEAKAESSESEYFSCYSSLSHLSSAGISKSSKWDPPPGHFLGDNTLVPEAKAESSESEYFSCYSSLSHLSSAGISKSSKWVPPPGHFLEDNTLVPEAKAESSESEYFSCYSSLSHLFSAEILKKQKDTTQPGESTSQEENNAVVSSDLPCASDNKNTEFLNTDEDIVLPGPSGLAQGYSQRAEVSDSEYISCITSADKPFDREFSKNQENVPQPESVVSSGSEIAGAKTSSSEYVCISPSGSHQKHQDVSHPGQSEQHETSSPFPYVSFPFHLVSSTKPSEPSVRPQKERLMKIYYMHVQMKRGVAVLSDPEEEQEPPSKKARLEEMTFPEKVHTEVTPSHVCTKELLTGSESSWNSEAQEEKEEADSPAETPAMEECPRAKTPEWLVALDSGFRCMGCCRVFPSLEALQEHVQHGVTEGFSCHKFHLALAWLKSKKNRAKKRRGENTRKRTHRGQKEHHSGMNMSSCK
ncbi:Protein FAM170A [Vulpes lagopus]